MSKELKPDYQWNNVYYKKPQEGQKCASKRSEENGYVSACTYRNGYFETHEDKGNRFVITRWKHDLWLPMDECYANAIKT